MSLVFYAWGEPIYVLLMIFSILFNYLSARSISYYAETGNEKLKKFSFEANIVINIVILCFFKYYGFVIENINSISGSNIPIHELALPIGISFYTFQTLSYVIDVYRNNVKVQKNIINFGAYITMFPQLIAGPIVRYADIEAQLNERTLELDKIAEGATIFIVGLAKKVLLANNVGMLFDQIMATSVTSRAALTTWLGVLAFTFQIYFDFSGYSDMAIGLGKMLGFDFMKNFDYPYISTSATEFWRRWHISLGTWFREYLYIPLGGNRVGPARHIFNILVVWALTGFWHGAAWNFVLWGLYYAILLIFEKYIYGKGLAKLPKIFQYIYSILITLFGWLLFSSNSIGELAGNFQSMFGMFENPIFNMETLYFFKTNVILLIACGFCSTPVIKNVFNKIASKKGFGFNLICALCYTIIFILSIAYLVNSTYNPFLYFRF